MAITWVSRTDTHKHTYRHTSTHYRCTTCTDLVTPRACDLVPRCHARHLMRLLRRDGVVFLKPYISVPGLSARRTCNEVIVQLINRANRSCIAVCACRACVRARTHTHIRTHSQLCSRNLGEPRSLCMI